MTDDIVTRLRGWRRLHLARIGELFDEAADEITRLWGDAEIARLRLEAARKEAERLRLTDKERRVLREVRGYYADVDDVACNEIAAVIDGLLERTT